MTKHPNILFFLSDQHNPRFVGYGGDTVVRTPALDRLADEGTAFSNAYCQNPLCVPSRASLITGRYSRNIGIYDNQDILEANCVTLPRHFARAGYRTCLIGKGHFNGEQLHGYGERPYGDLFGQAHQPDPRRLPEGGESGLSGWPFTAGPSAIPLAMTQTEICVAESVKWLQTHIGTRPEQPFFLSVHFDKPHFPVNPPRVFFERYDGAVSYPDVPADSVARHVPFVVKANEGFFDQGVYNQGDAASLRLLAAYYGCVEWVDDAIGRILASLDYLGLSEDTIVVYASDHGEMAGEHGCWQKTKFYDASARVPLVFRWRPGIPAGGRLDGIVGLIDLFPTLCTLSGVAVPEHCDGISLTEPLTRGGGIDRDGIFAESVVLKNPEYAGCMLRSGEWKYNYYLDGTRELYDLTADPFEYRNRADEPAVAGIVRGFDERITAFWEPSLQLERYRRAPRMAREKHFYEFSNQFITGDGRFVDARP